MSMLGKTQIRALAAICRNPLWGTLNTRR